MGNTGSTSKGVKITAQDQAMLDMKIQRDQLKKYQVKINSVMNREKQIAKIWLEKGDKKRALIAIRKKKYQERLLEKSFQQLNALDELINSVEFKLIEKDVLYGLSEGNKVLKTLNQELSLDKVEKLMDETEDGIKYQEEVSDLLGSVITNSQEDEVQAELERLELEESSKTVPKLPEVPHLPPLSSNTEPAKPEKELEGSSNTRVKQGAILA